jgi:hypothetical protein
MFRRTASADCQGCRQRSWELHCNTVRCSWYVCRICGVVICPKRQQSYDPNTVEQEQRWAS